MTVEQRKKERIAEKRHFSHLNRWNKIGHEFIIVEAKSGCLGLHYYNFVYFLYMFEIFYNKFLIILYNFSVFQTIYALREKV